MPKCPHCPYESNRAFDIKRHLARKKSCIPVAIMNRSEKHSDQHQSNIDDVQSYIDVIESNVDDVQSNIDAIKSDIDGDVNGGVQPNKSKRLTGRGWRFPITWSNCVE